MRRRIFAVLFWIGVAIFVVPSLALVAVLLIDLVLDCDMNPLDGITCAEWASPLVWLAGLGMLTIVPTAIVGLIWVGMTLIIAFVGRGRK